MTNLQPFKEWLNLNCKTERSASSYFGTVKSFFTVNDSFTQENVNNYLTSKIGTWQNSTWNKFLYSAKKYCIFSNLDIKFPKPKTIHAKATEYITEKEMLDIVEKLPLFIKDYIKAKAIIMLIFYTGLRPKEVLQLKKEDIDFSNRRIIVKNTKGYHDRPIVMSSKLCKILQDALCLSPYNDHLFDLSTQSLGYIIKRINMFMKPRFKLNPYSFRHSFAHFVLKKNGNNIAQLSQLLGHKEQKTTLIYTNITQNEAFEGWKKILK